MFHPSFYVGSGIRDEKMFGSASGIRTGKMFGSEIRHPESGKLPPGIRKTTGQPPP
jgi:hypothetical protein